MATVIKMPDSSTSPRPYQPYAIKFHQEDRIRGLSLLLHHSSGEIAGMRGRIFLLCQKDLAILDVAGVKYQKFEMNGRFTPEEILTAFDPEQKSQEYNQSVQMDQDSRPSLMKSLIQRIRDWYGSC